MSFTPAESAYLAGQTFARLATVGPDGPHVVPVGFHHDPELGTIDITGRDLAASRKFRDVLREPRVALVVDDVPPGSPPSPRGLEIRGTAEALGAGDDALIRVRPRRVAAWGIDAHWSEGVRSRDLTTKEHSA
ncbi:PPOX class F420-dependent oxidoreductase [Amycolatopsis speibonae]|uniref:PPOX class F420-dependent oxidoreductase n=1 Tax=Amycolatopsis speibonae TaxID=1450224 RepID=A0ABV7NRC8_9PSEU